jgi:MinD-like ATPase involved in chromosome partitioning or flagellar assembly
MRIVAVTSPKHSPGTTTASLAFASAWADESSPLLVEADPAGGDIAARAGLPFEPGLVSLAGAARSPGVVVEVDAHMQALPAGGDVIVAPASPQQVASALGSGGERLVHALATAGRPVVVDCGRWREAAPVELLLTRADRVLVVVRPTVEAAEHLRSRAAALRAAFGYRLGVVLVGDRPYGPSEVQAAIGLPVVGVLPVDRRGAAALVGRGRPGAIRRTALVRSARTLLERLRAEELLATEMAQ